MFISSAIRSHRWDEVMSWIRTEEGREELRTKCGYYKFLPLHEACSCGAPLEVVKAMLKEYPEAVAVTDKIGHFPLHVACGPPVFVDVSPGVVRLLFDAYPEVAKATDETGYRPLNWAVRRKAPLEVLRMLVEANPDGATTHAHNELPLHVLSRYASPDNVDDTEKVVVLLQPILENEEACRISVPDAGETPLHIAAKFRLLSLRACTALPWCPPDVIMTVARRHPRQLRERDEQGSLPLHRVVANPNLNGAKDAGADLVGKLIDMYPEAAATSDAEGRLPLVLAIESGKSWNEGVEALADAAEHVVTVRDEATNLYPFMLAATGNDACLTSVYSLLRCCPELKRYVLE